MFKQNSQTQRCFFKPALWGVIPSTQLCFMSFYDKKARISPCREENLIRYLPVSTSDITVSVCECGGVRGSQQTVHKAAHRGHGHPHGGLALRRIAAENVGPAHL